MTTAAALSAEARSYGSAWAQATTAAGLAAQAYQSLTSPAAEQAAQDIGDAINDAPGFDPDWAIMMSDAAHAGMPGAAQAYENIIHSPFYIEANYHAGTGSSLFVFHH
jgi:hypothetical protein